MPLRRSSFVHLIDLAGGIVLAIHAVSQVRLTVTPDVARLLRWFDEPRTEDEAAPLLAGLLGSSDAAIRACIRLLHQHGLLTDHSADAEQAGIAATLTETYGRDPAAQLDRYRRGRMEGAEPYWSVSAPYALQAPDGRRRRIDVLLLGDCDVQMETDFLAREAAARGIDLRVAASFSADIALASERRHDAIIVGALQARHAIVLGDPEHHGGDPARVYVESVETMVEKLRALTAAPILIDGLPEPSVQPLGFADSGLHSHRNRFRRTNLALAEMVGSHPDVHLIDVAAAFASAGGAALLDDGLVSFTHFGSPGWMLQRPASELAAVHHQFPDMQVLADSLDSDPYQREKLMARTHMDALAVMLGIGRKKCVIVDLDGVLWPGVLAETGSPFAAAPDISSPNSYAGLYFGIHEALLALRRRGILLACVSKNDETTVRALWRYQQHDPRHRLLRPEHFVAMRVNWQDKAENIRSIAEELGFATEAFLFVDDSERERERIQQALPEVTVIGDDLFSVRRILLTDPRLQPLRITDESARRGDMTKAQLERSRLRMQLPDESGFVASLEVVCVVERLTVASATSPVLERVSELIARTTQFNATGRSFSVTDLQHVIADKDSRIFILRMADRLADHGLVGAAVIETGEILNFVLSCRVIGLKGEKALLTAIVDDARDGGFSLRGRIVTTDRNSPVRNLYQQGGFTSLGDGYWIFENTASPECNTETAVYRTTGVVHAAE